MNLVPGLWADLQVKSLTIPASLRNPCPEFIALIFCCHINHGFRNFRFVKIIVLARHPLLFGRQPHYLLASILLPR